MEKYKKSMVYTQGENRSLNRARLLRHSIRLTPRGALCSRPTLSLCFEGHGLVSSSTAEFAAGKSVPATRESTVKVRGCVGDAPGWRAGKEARLRD